MLVQSHKHLPRCEEDHVEGDVPIEGGPKAKVESSESRLSDDCCEGLFAYVSQHHGSLGGTTYMHANTLTTVQPSWMMIHQ